VSTAAQPNLAEVSPASQPSLDCSRRSLVALSLVLAVLVFAAFQPALNNGFVAYDDPDYVTSNVMVQRGLNGDSIRWAFVTIEAANWHPLTWLSHLADVQMFGLNPAGHHLTSVLLHTLSSVLLFLTLRALTGAIWRSLIVAALFGLHPLRAESVAWVSERKDVLSAVFWFLTLLAYTRYVCAQDADKCGVRKLYGITLLCFAAGLLAKPMLVTLPFVLLLLDAWPLKRLGRKKFAALVLEKLPFFGLTVASCVITFVAQRNGGAVSEHTSFSYRLSNAVVSYVRYLGKSLWPTNLAFFYPPPQQWPTAFIIASLLSLASISVLVLRLRHSHPGPSVGWLWFLGTLIPVIGLVQVGQQSIADRYTYIPSVGLLIGLVWGVHALLSGRRQFAQALGIFAGAVSIICLLLTRQQTRVWKNTETLCRHAFAVDASNYLALDLLGDTLFKQGQIEQGLTEQRRALQLKPSYAEGYNNLAVNLQHQGQLSEAVKLYQSAIQLRPRYPQAHFNLGVALEAAGQLDNALTEYSHAIAQRPDYADAHYNLGLLYARLGRTDQAVAEFQTTLSINPNLADAHNNLGVALDRMGRLSEAIHHYQLAIVAKPDYPRAHFNFGVALTRAGELNRAASAFEAALRLKPDYAEARTNLAAVTAAMKSAAAPKP